MADFWPKYRGVWPCLFLRGSRLSDKLINGGVVFFGNVPGWALGVRADSSLAQSLPIQLQPCVSGEVYFFVQKLLDSVF